MSQGGDVAARPQLQRLQENRSMAELPDSNILGAPQPGSRRPVSSIDVSGYARGAAAIGSSTETLGKGITSAANDVAAVLQKERAAADKLELARARAYLHTAVINHGNAIEKEEEPADLEPKYQAKFDEDVEIASRAISDERAKEMFALGAKQHGARLASAANIKAFNLARDAGRANDVKTLNQLREAVTRSSDPNAVHMAVQSASDTIDGWTWIDRVDADSLKKTFAQELAAGKLDALPPVERYEALIGGAATRYAPLAGILPDGIREGMRIRTERELAQARAKASYEALSVTEQALDDASNGLSSLPPRQSIENNPDLQPPEKNRALARHDSTAADVAALKVYAAKFEDRNAGAFDPFDETTQRLTNRFYISRGRTPEALKQIVERTWIIPQDEASALRAALNSGKVPDVQAAMAKLSALPDEAFANPKGGRDLAEAREAFRAKVLADKSPAQAAQEYIMERTEDAVRPAVVQQRREAANKRLAALTYEEMRWYLQPTGGDPSVVPYEIGGSDAERKQALREFRNLVTEAYLEQRSPDINEAMARAALQFKTTFGLSTSVGPDPDDPKRKWGEPRVMRFAPSAWPGYRPRPGESPLKDIDRLVKKAAVQTIEKAIGDPPGWTLDPDTVVLQPIDFNQTAARFLAANPKHPPVYLLSFQDRHGRLQTIGTFEPKPAELRAIQSEEEEAEQVKQEARANAVTEDKFQLGKRGLSDGMPSGGQ
jgi:hypothetical protein